MALLEIQNVTRRFGDFTAVDGVSLAIDDFKSDRLSQTELKT